MQGFSVRNIKYMRTFAEAYPQFSIVQAPLAQIENAAKKSKFLIVQQPAAQLPWTHHQVILDKVKNINERLFYISKAIENGWRRDVMAHQIETKLHRRQGKTINNFKTTLPANQSDLVNETFKNPYIFDFLAFTEKLQETDLEKNPY